MTRTKSYTGRILSLFLSLTMMMVLFLPTILSVDASAAPTDSPYTITITPNTNTLTPKDDNTPADNALKARFKAYAIFTGDLNSDSYTQSVDGILSKNQLANVKWGKGVDANKYSDLLVALWNSDALLSDLGLTPSSLDESFTGTTLGEAFEYALTQNGYTYVEDDPTAGKDIVKAPENGELADSAAVVAAVISSLNGNTGNNSGLANAFAEIVEGYLSSVCTESTWSTANSEWTISGLTDAGYYLIIDTCEGNVNDEISKYMLAVFGSQTVKIKSNGATVDKWILENGTQKKGSDAGIGDIVRFRLKGTLSENFGSYKIYTYVFSDTMSTGLTYKGNVKVYAVEPDSTTKYEIDEDEFETDYQVGDKTVDEYYYGYGYQLTEVTTHSFKVKFSNLKNLKGTKVGEENATSMALNMTNEWTIEVEYDAEVNENAVVVDPGTLTGRNDNTVGLQYSNNVEKNEDTDGDGDSDDEDDNSSTGETPEETVYVYVYGLNADKTDGTKDNPDANALAGAGFALTNAAGEYAVFTKATSTDVETGITTYEYTIVDWITEAQAKTAVGTGTWKDSVLGSALNNATESTKFTAIGEYYLAVTTVNTDNKEVLKIKGIDSAVTYTLIEKFTPAGYETMDPIEFKLTAVIDATGNLTSLAGASTSARDDVKFSEAKNQGYVPVELRNMPAGYLPGTGGIGTVLFYVGGILMVGIGVMLIIRRKARKAAI